MPDDFVPLLARADDGAARFTLAVTAVEPAAVAATAPGSVSGVRRFEVDTTRTRPTPPAFDVSGRASIPEALLRAAREQARLDGRTAGYAAGLDAARRASAEDLAAAASARELAARHAEAEVRATLQAVRTAADRLEAQTASITEALAEQTLSAVASLTAAVLGHALAQGEDTALDAVRRALDPLPGTGPVVVRLSPTDAEVILRATTSNRCDEIDPQWGPRRLSVVADPLLDRGDAVASSGVTEVEARLGTALERALEALRS